MANGCSKVRGRQRLKKEDGKMDVRIRHTDETTGFSFGEFPLSELPALVKLTSQHGVDLADEDHRDSCAVVGTRFVRNEADDGYFEIVVE